MINKEFLQEVERLSVLSAGVQKQPGYYPFLLSAQGVPPQSIEHLRSSPHHIKEIVKVRTIASLLLRREISCAVLG